MSPGAIYKAIIILASLHGTLFWLWFLWQRPGYDADNGASAVFLSVAMITLSVMMVTATAKVAPKWVLGLSIVAFFPVGYYFMNGNSWWFSSVGCSYLVIMAASSGWLYRR